MVTKSSKKMDKGSVLQATIAYLRNYKGELEAVGDRLRTIAIHEF